MMTATTMRVVIVFVRPTSFKLLRRARSLLDLFMFEGEQLRDDVANLCMQIDDVLPPVEESAHGAALDAAAALHERVDVAA